MKFNYGPGDIVRLSWDNTPMRITKVKFLEEWSPYPVELTLVYLEDGDSLTMPVTVEEVQRFQFQ
ncbi:hypothetical protein GCM10027098_25550 [Bowmanella dokdonensis]